MNPPAPVTTTVSLLRMHDSRREREC
jgi:hypothetical protein